MNKERTKSHLPPLWRNRNYLLLWSGQAISDTGTQVSHIAVPLLILMLTKSPAQAGLAAAFLALPYFLFALPVGALVDRWDRQRTMITCDIGRALCLVSIPIALLLGHLTIVQIYIAAFLEGCLAIFFDLAEAATLHQAVPKEQLPAAIAQNQVTSQGTTLLVGPSLGAILYGINALFPFFVDAGSYIVSVCSLLYLRLPQPAEAKQEEVQQNLQREIGEGIRWLWHQPVLRLIAFLNGSIGFVFAGETLVVIVLAQQLHASAVIIGFIFTTSGVGGILGSLLSPLLQKKLHFGVSIICLFWLFALLWGAYAFASQLIVLVLIFFFLSLIAPIYAVMQGSYRLAMIPGHLQGRVGSIYRLFSLGMQPLGAALTGVCLQTLHIIPTILILFSMMLVLALFNTFNPRLRHTEFIATTNTTQPKKS